MFTQRIIKNITHYKNRTAFCITDVLYSYAGLKRYITGIQSVIKKHKVSAGDVVIVETFNDIETYSSILALWFLGVAFVPINPKHPAERNKKILQQVKPQFILSSQNKISTIYTKDLQADTEIEICSKIRSEDLLYILFTSGSTGIPKGVKISHGNLSAFLDNFLAADYNLSSNDRFLQVYDLTFDASFHSWVLPLYIGASIFTVNPDKPKYLQAYKLMEQYKLTFAKFPPSLLSYLRPYFTKINLSCLRYSLLGGESLNLQLALDWAICIPNAQIHNVYGPTEATINTHIFIIDTQVENKAKVCNGNLAIGYPFGDNGAVIIDYEKNILPPGKKGELCLAGMQLSPGYFADETKNKDAFIEILFNGKPTRFYRTGDSAFTDADGDFIFCGRLDDQVQINGYRVELGEIEEAARKFGKAMNYASVAETNSNGISEIYLFTEQLKSEISDLLNFLKANLPAYMIPVKIINLAQFPHTPGGKIDRNALKIKINV